jgi:putative toxin-antitoxin system antitoxin component (TIGR02293 family)
MAEGKVKSITKKIGRSVRASQQQRYPGYNSNIIFVNLNTKPENKMTPLEKMVILESGVRKLDLEGFKSRAQLDYDQLSKALAVTRSTLIRKKGEQKFSANISEKILGLADIYSYGYEVFEDEIKFNNWMFRPNQALGGKSPYNIIDNQYGREEVKDLIGRIDYGIFS